MQTEVVVNKYYDPIAVANFFIDKALSEGVDLTPMKLLKLVYIAHGWNMAVNEAPLINEAVIAWKYGPVIESIYHIFKKYGKNSITKLEYRNGNIPFIPASDAATNEVLNRVWDTHKDFSGVDLSAMTHLDDSPWSQTSLNRTIPNDMIRRYYVSLGMSNSNE